MVLVSFMVVGLIYFDSTDQFSGDWYSLIPSYISHIFICIELDFCVINFQLYEKIFSDFSFHKD